MTRSKAVLAWTLLAVCPAFSGVARASGVRVEIGASGRRVIVNENSVQRSRRLAGKLVPVPDADLAPLIQRNSDDQNLDPKLVEAVIQVESGYNHKALSNKGAMGLMQLMPDTASLFNVRDAFDPQENLRAGTRYLRQLLDRFAGRVELALAGYNAGPGAVEKHGGVPPYAETRDYVKQVMALYRGDRGGRVTQAGNAEFASLRIPPVPQSVAGSASDPLPPNRRKPRLVRGPNNRLLVTTSFSGLR
ncbi:MAG TPA: lytic transglycosylase domain-containing protein [Thermoanaerobaculia bacterium]|nr:lytic transglycosylase domain-containing protein [Thermoanaerobaculia bacterium]